MTTPEGKGCPDIHDEDKWVDADGGTWFNQVAQTSSGPFVHGRDTLPILWDVLQANDMPEESIATGDVLVLMTDNGGRVCWTTVLYNDAGGLTVNTGQGFFGFPEEISIKDAGKLYRFSDDPSELFVLENDQAPPPLWTLRTNLRIKGNDYDL